MKETVMEKIASFQVDHTKLLPGIYLSRTDDANGEIVYTYDIRMLTPNKEPVMDTCILHTLEHLGATYLRTVQKEVPIIYFGPMGCRTGFYLITAQELSSEKRCHLVKDMLQWIISFEGKVPGASAEECGNYLDLNLNMAQYQAKAFYQRLLNFSEKNYVYPSF